MSDFAQSNPTATEPEVLFVGFALSDCVVELDQQLAKYLRPVHRTALELAVHNRFGADVGGFWLTQDQIVQLRKLPEYYLPDEAPYVAAAVEAYLLAQLAEMYPVANTSLMKH